MEANSFSTYLPAQRLHTQDIFNIQLEGYHILCWYSIAIELKLFVNTFICDMGIAGQANNYDPFLVDPSGAGEPPS